MPEFDQSDLRESIILDHNERPRRFFRMKDPSCSVEATNPICGDRFCFDLVIDRTTVKQVSFVGRGCSLSKASASILASALKDKSIDEVVRVRSALYEMLISTDEPGPPIPVPEFEAFRGVRDHPSRVRCVTMGWDAVVEAITS